MLKVYETELRSRLLLGTSRYPSPAVLTEAVKASRAEVVTVSLRRESSGERAGQGFWRIIRELGVRGLPCVDAMGCADRFGKGSEQSVRPEGAAGAFPRRAAHH